MVSVERHAVPRGVGLTAPGSAFMARRVPPVVAGRSSHAARARHGKVFQQAHGPAANTTGLSARVAGQCLCTCMVASTLAGRRRRRKASVVIVAAASEDQLLAEARAAAEAAKLELEAARLRAEAEALERANAADRRASRARELLGEDGATSVSVTDLRTRLMQVAGFELSEERALWLVQTVRPGQDELALRFQELSSEAFDSALERVLAQEQEARRQAQAQERERERQEAERRRQEQPASSSSMPSDIEENDDRTMGTRVLGCLAYLLPLIDAFQFGLPLAMYIPALAPLFALLSIPNALINAIPFGSLILFILMTALASNREFPRLLRFNLQQAVLLDVAMFLPSIIASLGSMAMGGSGAVGPELASVIFIILVLMVGYAVVLTLLGRDPDGIPFVSDTTKRSIDGPFGR